LSGFFTVLGFAGWLADTCGETTGKAEKIEPCYNPKSLVWRRGVGLNWVMMQ
jgi:hypothetical protein